MRYLGALLIFAAIAVLGYSFFGSFENGLQQLVVVGWGIGLLLVALAIQADIIIFHFIMITNQMAKLLERK
jgi:hypothetical protein